MNNINKLVLAIGFTLTTFPSLAAGFQCGEHVTLGVPGQSSQLLCREGYAAGWRCCSNQGTIPQFGDLIS